MIGPLKKIDVLQNKWKYMLNSSFHWFCDGLFLMEIGHPVCVFVCDGLFLMEFSQNVCMCVCDGNQSASLYVMVCF